MAIRKEQSSYNVSLQLKTALASKGILGEVSVTEVYYSGGATERHYIDSDMSDGTFRTIVKNGTAIDFDFVDSTDTALVRLWIKRELDVFTSGVKEYLQLYILKTEIILSLLSYITEQHIQELTQNQSTLM